MLWHIWSQFSSTFTWVLGIKLRSLGLHSEHPYPLNHFVGPTLFSESRALPLCDLPVKLGWSAIAGICLSYTPVQGLQAWDHYTRWLYDMSSGVWT